MNKEDIEVENKRRKLESRRPKRITVAGGAVLLHKGLRLAKIVIINVLLLFILTELISVGFYFKKTGQFYYFAKSRGADEAATLGIDETRLDRGITERLHLYFGFTHGPESSSRTGDYRAKGFVNNYGFDSPHDYPFKKHDGQFVVGVFGGSVARNYAVYEGAHGILARALKQVPALHDREIVILPLAYSGYKQPQQLLVLNYFLSSGQDFDLVINIDGFNEVALSNLNTKAGIEISMPSIQHISPLVNLSSGTESAEELESLLRIKQYKARLKSGLQGLQECTTGSCYLLHLLYVRYLTNGYRKEAVHYDQFWAKKFTELHQDPLIRINSESSLKPESPEAFARMADLWMESSRLMGQILAARSVPYYHFIQPNQYYPTRRVFGEEEKKIAIQEDSRYVTGARGGYPALLGRVDDLSQTAVKVISAVNVFDEVQGAVYVDSCCHFNETGSSVFASFVADAIKADVGRFHRSPH